MSKFTKGRWYLQPFTDAYTNIVRCDNEKGMETIWICNCHGTSKTDRPNARLMAAAPDMLAALERCQKYFEMNRNGGCNGQGNECEEGSSYDLAIKAIHKALDETKDKPSVF